MTKIALAVKLLLLLLITHQLGIAQTTNQPNIILIIADDLGWSQVSTGLTNLGNPSDFYETPKIEEMASEGMSFPQAYVCGANCAPSRAAILSGQYASRATNNVFGVRSLNRGKNQLLIAPNQGISNGEDELPDSTITIAEVLKSMGYSTAHFGKYHVGGSVSNNKPQQQGFDYNYGGGSPGNPGFYFAQKFRKKWKFSNKIGPELDRYAKPYSGSQSQLLAGNNSLKGTPKHITDALTDAAFDFMEDHKSAPFFMHFSQYAVHTPYGKKNARRDLFKKYYNKKQSSPSQMGHNNISHAALAEGMDQSIGRILDYLKNTPDPRNPGQMLSANTLVYFISDNGGEISSDDNGPLRGMKGEYYEGGIRSVTIAWGPNLIAGSGSVNQTPMMAFDLYPTFIDYANGEYPNGYKLDGVSNKPLLDGSSTTLDRANLFWHFPGYLKEAPRDVRPVSIIRKGDYKLIYNYETQFYELYNVIADISETTNLLDGNPAESLLAIAHEMSVDLVDYLIDVDAPLPFFRNNSGGNSNIEVPLPYIIDSIPSTIEHPILEYGIINQISDDWQTITLENDYENMVVVATPMYSGINSLPAVTRVKNASGNSFEIRLQNPKGNVLNNDYAIHYLVVEEGRYTIADNGIKMEAAKVSSVKTAKINKWTILEPRTYKNNYAKPVILGQVMSENNPDWSVFWSCGNNSLTPPSSTKLNIGKHIGEDSYLSRPNEEIIGYLVFDQGNYTLDNYNIEVARGNNIVRNFSNNNNQPYKYSYKSILNPETILLSNNKMEGNNGGWPALFGHSGIRSSSFDLIMDEDQINDDERLHTLEPVAYLAIKATNNTNKVINREKEALYKAPINNEEFKTINIYPNPTASNHISIEISDIEDAQLIVTNEIGQYMPITYKILNNAIEVDITSLSNGSYFVKIIKNATNYNGKFIVQR